MANGKIQVTVDLPDEVKQAIADTIKRALDPEWQEEHRRMGFEIAPSDREILKVLSLDGEEDHIIVG